MSEDEKDGGVTNLISGEREWRDRMRREGEGRL